MSLKTIAESVGDTPTVEAPRAIGVDYGQGMAIAPPRALNLS